jgi:hypothetical protein
MSDKTKILTVRFTPHLFPDYVIPLGMLPEHAGAHALFYYYLLARKQYEEIIIDPIVLEGDKDPEFHLKQLFTSIALAYGIEPEEMVKFWPHVDAQCAITQLPKMPEGDQFRFNGVSEISTKEIAQEGAKLRRQQLAKAH